MISESDIKDYILKACAIVGGHGLDYLTISVPSTRAARSFSEHARVITEGKAPQDVANEVWGHAEDIVQNAANEGKNEAAFRICLYRAKAPGGSRTWRTDAGPGGGNSANDTDDEIGDIRSVVGAMVGITKELRIANGELLGAVKASASEGWRLAAEFAKETRELRKDNTELQIVVATASQDNMAGIKEIGVKAANEFIEVMKIKAATKIAEEASEKQRKLTAENTK